MKHLVVLSVLLVLAGQVNARQFGGIPDGTWGQVPDISGTWFMNGSANQPCEIIQRRPDGRAQFVNEKGSMAWAQLNGDRVFIPDWNEGRGERGIIRGDRIVWPNGSYWSRNIERGPPPPPYYDPNQGMYGNQGGYGGQGYGGQGYGGQGYGGQGYGSNQGYGGQWGRGSSRQW